jgi:DNA-binding GntR family transcriptional regulator
LTDATGRTLYTHIADDLRSQIASGALQIGDPIPSTAELKGRYGYSSTVVRKAVEVLRNEGLLVGQPGKAVYVHATPAAVEAERASIDDLAHQISELRVEVRGLAKRIDSEDRLKDLTTEVAELRGTVEQLYARLGHSYPAGDPGLTQPRRRNTGS